jgi:intracellular sulfur oxidation DsrE/DsrF family protein
MKHRSSRSTMSTLAALLAVVSCAACAAPSATSPAFQWPTPAAPAVPEADGYATIPDVALPPEKSTVYRAIFDATRAADQHAQILPALNMAGSELNALAASDVPLANAQFVIVFHGQAVDGLLTDTHYRDKFGVANPNLPVLTALQKAGVELYVCGQQLAADGVDPSALTPLVKVASDALIVSMTYQNKGYALLSY